MDDELRDGDGGAGESLITLSARHSMPEIGRRVKSLNYLTAAYSARELAAAGVREGILCTGEGIVAEGTVSNLFCVVDGALHTPPLALGVLDGVTRGRVIELARERGIAVHETLFDLDRLLGADECFYTNSVREVVPIGAIDGRPISDRRPGPITAMLRAAYRAEAPREEVTGQ